VARVISAALVATDAQQVWVLGIERCVDLVVDSTRALDYSDGG
jgi:hypothetical protein